MILMKRQEAIVSYFFEFLNLLYFNFYVTFPYILHILTLDSFGRRLVTVLFSDFYGNMTTPQLQCQRCFLLGTKLQTISQMSR